MRLNASALNQTTVNGGPARLAVRGAGDAALALTAAVTATRITRIQGELAWELEVGLLARAERFGAGSVPIVLAADVEQTVSRGGRGAATLTFFADLYYTKQGYLTGSAVIELAAVAYIGIQFGGGAAVLWPAEASLALVRGRTGAGVGAMSLHAALEAQATRRTTLVAETFVLSGDLDASHIDDLGQRYIGASGAAIVPVAAEDAGMLRQSFLGSLDFDITSSGSGSLEKPTLDGSAPIDILMAVDSTVQRFGVGEARLVLGAALAGEVLVPGAGDASFRLVASGTGYVLKRSLTGEADLSLVGQGEGNVVVPFAGEAPLTLGVTLTGSLAKVGFADAEIVLFSASDAYLNPNAMDIEEQWFYRPAAVRDLARLAVQRDFLRTP